MTARTLTHSVLVLLAVAMVAAACRTPSAAENRIEVAAAAPTALATAEPIATPTPSPAPAPTTEPIAEPTVDPGPTAVAIPDATATATETPEPTATSEPTPTATPQPTNTPVPQQEAPPTATPELTATPEPEPTEDTAEAEREEELDQLRELLGIVTPTPDPLTITPTATPLEGSEAAEEARIARIANGGEVYTASCARCHAGTGVGTLWGSALIGSSQRYSEAGMISEMKNRHQIHSPLDLSDDEIRSVATYVLATFG